MVEVALRNAESLGLDVDGRVADAEPIPYEDDDVRRRRRPRRAAPHPRPRRGVPRGAAGAQAGRPVRVRGRADPDRRPLRPVARRASPGRPPRRSPGCPRWRRGGARRRSWTSRRGPRRWRRSSTSTRSTRPSWKPLARSAGAADVRVVTEEFTAAMLGWPVRTFEAAVPPERLGFGWAMFAYRSWQRLSWLDARGPGPRGAAGVVLQRGRHGPPGPRSPTESRRRAATRGWRA